MKVKKVLKNIISTFITQIVTILCGFIIPATIIRAYGSNVNGLVTSITQFLAYITLLESGIGPVVKAALYKPIANKNKQEIANILRSTEKFFRTIAYIFIAYIIVLCVAFPAMMQGQFSATFTLSLVIIISISTVAEYYFGMTYKLFLQAEQKTYIVSNIQTITTAMNAGLILILIKFGANIQVVKAVSAMVFVLRPILQNLYVKKKYDINLKDAESGYKLKQKWDGLAQHIASVVHNNTDVAILTIFCDIKEVSIYSVYSLVIKAIENLMKSLISGIDDFCGDLLAKNEKKQLNRFFEAYELGYFSIITIIFSCTLLLILPFISVYTQGVTDVSYYRPVFAYIIVLAEFMYIIRLPYVNITYAAGHFKETRLGAWIEAGTNIIISVILVSKFGIDGVAVGTLIAMTIRAIEFMYHSSKYILERKVWYTIKRLVIVVIEVLLVIGVSGLLPHINITNYFTWALQGIITAVIATIIVLGINVLVYKNDVKDLINILKNKFLKKSQIKEME